jgi:hypothetical protein
MADINFYSGIEITGDLGLSGTATIESNLVLKSPTGATTAPNMYFREARINGEHSISLQAPNAVTTSLIYTLPGAMATPGQILQCTSSGTMSWTDDKNIGSSNLTLQANRKLILDTYEFWICQGLTTYPTVIFGANNTTFGKGVLLKADVVTTDSVALTFHAGNTSDYISLQSPNTLSASNSYVLPSAYPASNKVLQSSSTGTMSWVDAGGADTNIANTNLTADNNRTLDLDGYSLSFLDGSSVNLKSASATAAALHFYAPSASAYSVSLQAPTLLESTAYTLPKKDGASKQVLSTNGSGILDWEDGINIGTSSLTINGTSTSRTLTLSSGSGSNFKILDSNTAPFILFQKGITDIYSKLRIQPKSGSSLGGVLQIYEKDTGGSGGYVGLKVGASHSASINYTLPTGPPASNKVLQSTSTGIMSWVAGGGTDTNIANTNLTTDNVGRTLTLINSGTWGIYDNNASMVASFSSGTILLQSTVQIISNTASANALEFRGNTSSGPTYVIGLQAPDSVTADAPYILPQLPATSGQVLSSTDAGVMSWVDAGGADTNIGNTNLTTDVNLRSLTLENLGAFEFLEDDGDTLFRVSELGNFSYKGLSLKQDSAVAAGAPLTFLEGSAGTNFISLRAPDTVTVDSDYTLPEFPSVNGLILASQTDGTMSWAASAPTPTLIMGGGGQVRITTSVDNNARIVVCGGSYGFNYYAWNENVYGAAPDFTGLGVTVGTISTTLVTPTKANRGQFKSISGGKVQISGTIRSVNNSDIYNSVTYIYVFKVPDAIVTSMGDGTAQSSTDYTLVASASCTMAASDTSNRPQSFASSNGVNIDKDDWIFVGVAFANQVSANRYLELNFNVYTE